MIQPGQRDFAKLILLAMLLAPAGCRENTPPSAGGPDLRVGLLLNVDRVDVRADATLLAKSANESQPHKLNFPKGASVAVMLAGDVWRVGNVSLAAGELRITPDHDGSVSVNGKAYRGQYLLVPSSANRFDVINEVPIESYLKGVLPGELPGGWNIEAYKAQAVAARTYAIYESKTKPASRRFDVFDDTRSQVYDGINAETAKAREAVDATAGFVMAYAVKGEKPKIFKTYFSACCGGVGQSVADAFNETAIPPLTEQSVGGTCNISTRFNWAPIVLTKAELTRRIRAFGAKRNRAEKDMATLDRIEIAQQNQFGRPVRFWIIDTRGTRYSMSGEETRWACNADANGGPILWSSFFRPINEPGTIRFAEGHGYGHGVGLCQWCAEARAREGMNFLAILSASYPRAVVVPAYPAK